MIAPRRSMSKIEALAGLPARAGLQMTTIITITTGKPEANG